MADKKLAAITALEAGTKVDRQYVRASGEIGIGVWAKLAAETDDDVIYILPVRASDVITSIKIFNDAITGLSDADLGVVETDGTGGDPNLFGDALDLTSASTTGTEVVHEALAVGNLGKPIYELLGESTYSERVMYLALTLVTGGTATGDAEFVVSFAA